jgi:branched-chain amino acid aminotransferase
VKVWIDGRVVEADEARIPVLDHGFLYGDGVFEGIRALGRRVYKLEGHLARFAASARAIAIELPGGVAAARDAVLETLRALGRDEAYVRLIATRGEGPLGVDPTTCPRARLVCLADVLRLFSAETAAVGIELVTVSLRRPPADVLDPRVKSLNYLNNALAKLEARQRGADEALLLNHAGMVAEASAANVFAAIGGRLLTPLPTDGALAGMTRAGVLELAAELGIPAEERPLGRYDLLAADEVFLTGSGAGIVPVGRFDGRPVGAGAPGPITARIAAAFPDYARRCGTPF